MRQILLFSAGIGFRVLNYFSAMILKTIAVMSLAVLISTVGDILMAQGLKELGELKVTGIVSLFKIAGRVLKSLRVIAGVLCMIGFFALWLSALSWADLSLVMPMTAMTYVLNAILSKIFLHEYVSAKRWWGTVLIVAGVVMVTLSGA